jgi:hypothetical protein
MALWVPAVESIYFKRQNTIYRKEASDSRSTDSESADDCNMTECCKRLKNMSAVMMLMRQVYFSTYNIVSVLLYMVTPTMVKKFKRAFTVLHAFNDDGSNKTITVGNWQI